MNQNPSKKVTAPNERDEHQFENRELENAAPRCALSLNHMGRLLQIVHHRSLTVSIVALSFAFLALGFLPEHSYRIEQQGGSYLLAAAVIALLGLFICTFTLIILLRDNRSGYPAPRC